MLAQNHLVLAGAFAVPFPLCYSTFPGLNKVGTKSCSCCCLLAGLRVGARSKRVLSWFWQRLLLRPFYCSALTCYVSAAAAAVPKVGTN